MLRSSSKPQPFGGVAVQKPSPFCTPLSSSHRPAFATPFLLGSERLSAHFPLDTNSAIGAIVGHDLLRDRNSYSDKARVDGRWRRNADVQIRKGEALRMVRAETPQEAERKTRMYRVHDENPFQDTPAAREMMRKAFPPKTFSSLWAAQDEAYRRSFINATIPSAVYGNEWQLIGRCLDGKWTHWSDLPVSQREAVASGKGEA